MVEALAAHLTLLDENAPGETESGRAARHRETARARANDANVRDRTCPHGCSRPLACATPACRRLQMFCGLRREAQVLDNGAIDKQRVDRS